MSVVILSLESTTVAMAKMQEWSANVSSKLVPFRGKIIKASL